MDARSYKRRRGQQHRTRRAISRSPPALILHLEKKIQHRRERDEKQPPGILLRGGVGGGGVLTTIDQASERNRDVFCLFVSHRFTAERFGRLKNIYAIIRRLFQGNKTNRRNLCIKTNEIMWLLRSTMQ